MKKYDSWTMTNFLPKDSGLKMRIFIPVCLEEKDHPFIQVSKSYGNQDT